MKPQSSRKRCTAGTGTPGSRALQLAALAVVALAAGCTATSPHRAKQPEPVSVWPRRVVIVPFADRTAYTGTAEKFIEALREKLARRTRGADVVIAAPDELPVDFDPFGTGRMPVETLVALRRACRADVLIIGTVEQHDPYRPPSIDLSLKVVDTAHGRVLFEMSDGWDGATAAVRRQIQEYYATHYGEEECRFGAEFLLTCPRYYLRFVADRVAGRIVSRMASAPAQTDRDVALRR